MKNCPICGMRIPGAACDPCMFRAVITQALRTRIRRAFRGPHDRAALADARELSVAAALGFGA